MIAAKQIESGMIPKVQACLDALGGGVERCHIIDGRLPHALLMELLTDVGIGTMVVKG
jgi:acetylglutamate kinase